MYDKKNNIIITNSDQYRPSLIEHNQLNHLKIPSPIKAYSSPLNLTKTMTGQESLAHSILERSRLSYYNGIFQNAKQNFDNSKGQLNYDPSPLLIHKKPKKPIFYTQDVAVKFLKPPSPPPPGDLHILQESDIQQPPIKPLVIKHVPPRPVKPPPLVLREKPPLKPEHIPTEFLRIPGKVLPPPARKVILEKYPRLPEMPQDIVVERWLDYPERKRRVIFQRAKPLPPLSPQKNVIIEWNAPQLHINRKINVSYTSADPDKYNQVYGSSTVKSEKIPDFIKNIRPYFGERLAAEGVQRRVQLVGDVDALKYLNPKSIQIPSPNGPTSIPSSSRESPKKRHTVSFAQSVSQQSSLFKESFLSNDLSHAHMPRSYF